MTTDITELALLVSKAKASVFTLEYISQFEPADIDSDDVDLRFEVDGRDTGTNVSIVDECGQAAKVIGELVEALEKAQDTINEMDNRIRKQNRHICELFDDNKALRQRIAELESRAVKIVDCDFGAVQHMSGGSNDYCDGFVDGTQNAIRSISAAGIKVEIK
ncbi:MULTISPECIES: ead/Ea22-like family protein [Klebsiella pneumoniae complex]|uniref:ead/Ea22-like family protein n=1 Tax=Klebsiella pneumoniae complex TaxID=3390273 RepID=UPI000D744B19|nr:ead/Ea22-like family protein [Klebsiella variicola]PXL59004.1 hypothetical protein DMS35_03345 [Klebsiella variicola]